MNFLLRLLAAVPFVAFAGAIVGAALVLPSPARAGCCRVVKVDPGTPSALVQVCEPGQGVDPEEGAETCAGLLFSGTLALGESQEVCTVAPTVVYREWDALLDAFGPPVEARCEDRDVEI